MLSYRKYKILDNAITIWADQRFWPRAGCYCRAANMTFSKTAALSVKPVFWS